MDEVNERFPLIKYKVWRSSRANAGLSTTGGISAPDTSEELTTKAEDADLSVRNGDASSLATSPLKTHQRLNSNPSESSMPLQHTEPRFTQPEEKALNDLTDPGQMSLDITSGANKQEIGPHDENILDQDDDNDHYIPTAVPPDFAASPGDSCAICLDLIEDDDDIRGLACGHAFHASCVDPWLTSRRASCPLCKADYYIPKPRSDAAEPTTGSERNGRNATHRTTVPRQPQAVFIRGRVNPFRQPMALSEPHSQAGPNNTPISSQPVTRLFWRLRDVRSQSTDHSLHNNTEVEQSVPHSRGSRISSRLFSIRHPFSNGNRDLPRNTGASPSGTAQSPSQLEAGHTL
ncbi:hypothetical protein AOCH_000279 [Aspergillus ochraceoroseus]|nr:hypothetical protein AOCH_000279 [Aspergillus ochraceoroseus]